MASGDQTSEEAHLWARIQEQALGGGPIVCGPEGGAGWECAGRYSARIADLDDADVVVVAGATEPGAPRADPGAADPPAPSTAARRSSRSAPAPPGWTRCAHAEHISAAPGTAHAALLAAVPGPWRWDGAQRPRR